MDSLVFYYLYYVFLFSKYLMFSGVVTMLKNTIELIVKNVHLLTIINTLSTVKYMYELHWVSKREKFF